MVRFFAVLIIVLGAALATAAQPQGENEWLRKWIPVHCCVTNNCCFEIKSTDLEPLPGDSWKIRATGQVLARTNWSPDGKWYRCACDFIEGNWVVHAKANTRCIFPPMQSAKVVAPYELN